MRISFVRHATFVFESGGRRVTPVDDGLQWDGLGFTRDELRGELQREGLAQRVEIPADGETLEVP